MTKRTAFSTTVALVGAASVAVVSASAAMAYDGTKCKEPGVCWEPKPGFPDKIAGSKYDPKHDPAELAKGAATIKEMEARNAARTENFVKTGKWVYDTSKF